MLYYILSFTFSPQGPFSSCSGTSDHIVIWSSSADAVTVMLLTSQKRSRYPAASVLTSHANRSPASQLTLWECVTKLLFRLRLFSLFSKKFCFERFLFFTRQQGYTAESQIFLEKWEEKVCSNWVEVGNHSQRLTSSLDEFFQYHNLSLLMCLLFAYEYTVRLISRCLLCLTHSLRGWWGIVRWHVFSFQLSHGLTKYFCSILLHLHFNKVYQHPPVLSSSKWPTSKTADRFISAPLFILTSSEENQRIFK